MSKRTDLESILILGAGPIVIGQACEFDYSGVQACRALKEEGYRVVLVNSNPATIMTDPENADSIYIEPIQWQSLSKIIEREKPDALLPTMGGQSALNCSLDLARKGVLEDYGVEMIGASRRAIDTAEDRKLFRQAMEEIGLRCTHSRLAHNLEQAQSLRHSFNFPIVVRPSFTLGGSGGGIAYTEEQLKTIVAHGLDLSPTREVSLEESLLGWKEFETEVVRDRKDNCIIVCTIENLDPMGVHTGDSITVAPAQTLTDKEYQRMRDASIAVLRRIGVETGGANVQFAIDPRHGDMVVVEMNPRVSRSSALASKATGFPIAKVAAKLAVGYTLDELRNEMTGQAIPASFEPTIDYVVTKIPRFNFEKFPQAEDVLSTQMKSVGEVMSIGRSFKESLQKSLRSLETDSNGLNPMVSQSDESSLRLIEEKIKTPNSQRLYYIADGFRHGLSTETIYQWCRVDPWFLAQIESLVRAERDLQRQTLDELSSERMLLLKRDGFSDDRLAALLGCSAEQVKQRRDRLGLAPVFKRVDTCAAEFDSETAYLYSTYEDECEARPSQRKKIVILGSGPNRIGQGIEFDYCCVHASMALREAGFETIMINCNPETVSTDYDVSDRLYFEPLTFENVSEIIALEKPDGVVVQYGGQTPLKLARSLEEAGAPIIGTSPDAIDLAEDRQRFKDLVTALGLKQPANATCREASEALPLAEQVGYPLVVRPSYVLGGQAMEIIYSREELEVYMRKTRRASGRPLILLDHFLEDAIEVDVDAVSDGKRVLVAGIMQHIEKAGIHSGDSACSLPPFKLSMESQNELRKQTTLLAQALKVCGLMNVQFAIQKDAIYILEVNPRASRTIPFVSKAIGMPLAKIAARCMSGEKLSIDERASYGGYYSVKEAVFPFIKFKGVDPLLSPEMKSTGEAMGVGRSFGEAFSKAQQGAGNRLPSAGTALLSVRDEDKQRMVVLARSLLNLKFCLLATSGTAACLRDAGLACEMVYKVKEGKRPHIVDKINHGEVSLIVNTTEGRQAIADSSTIRRSAVQNGVCYTTTLAGAEAILEALQCRSAEVYRLQDLHKTMDKQAATEGINYG